MQLSDEASHAIKQAQLDLRKARESSARKGSLDIRHIANDCAVAQASAQLAHCLVLAETATR